MGYASNRLCRHWTVWPQQHDHGLWRIYQINKTCQTSWGITLKRIKIKLLVITTVSKIWFPEIVFEAQTTLLITSSVFREIIPVMSATFRKGSRAPLNHPPTDMHVAMCIRREIIIQKHLVYKLVIKTSSQMNFWIATMSTANCHDTKLMATTMQIKKMCMEVRFIIFLWPPLFYTHTINKKAAK